MRHGIYSRLDELFAGNKSPAVAVCISESAAAKTPPTIPKTPIHKTMSKLIKYNHNQDGIDRRGFLECMAWAGTGVLWTLTGGLLQSQAMSQPAAPTHSAGAPELSFVQISDSHIGFNKEANPDVAATLREAVAKINALSTSPSFLLHTGDLTHLAAAEEFDTLEQMLKSCRAGQVFYVPGEHDVLNDNGRLYRQRFGKGTKGSGWLSFDQKGVHFVGLVNVMDIKEGGMGVLGREQLAW